MYQFNKMRTWAKWPLVRAHLCTLAVSVSLNSTWRVPRLAYRFGGLQHGLVLTAAMALALPLALLHLALGQLSQQDAVGVWRAVPFFKGVGYLRLLVSFLGCVYTVIHVALTITYFLYTLSNSIPFDDCIDLEITEDGYQNRFNASDCLSATFMAPVTSRPEYYISISLIMIFIWIALPFLLYSPVKLMKRIFYVLGPVLVVACLVIVSCVGSGERLRSIHDAADWAQLMQPYAWLEAIAQALISMQVAGGYLISAGDSIYFSTNVQWTAIAFVGTNIVASWGGLLFWFAVSGSGGDAGSAAVLAQMYQVTEQEDLTIVWPLLVYAVLFLSGIITMLMLLYPIYDRIRRLGGARWRVVCTGASAVGAGLSLATFAGHEVALAAVEDVAVPLLISVTTVLEIVAFVFIYGWKALIEDVEFLTGQDLSKYWVVGWCALAGVVTPLALWWLVDVLVAGVWSQPSWSASVVVATGALMFLVILAFAAVVVARQVQYDAIGKLKSSFRPSRHWGPRDPITHYYWLARREEVSRGETPRTRYQGRQMGQLSGASPPLNERPTVINSKDINSNEVKRRSHSDDWVYTVYRRKYLKETFAYITKSKRSMSLDWDKIPRVKKDSVELKTLGSTYMTPIESAETVFKDALSEVKKNVSFSC